METLVNIYIKSSSLTDCLERGECVFVYTEYDPDMVEIFKSTPCSRWSDTNKCWELLKCMVRVFIRSVRELEKKKNIKYQFFLSDDLKCTPKDIHMDKFTFVTTPYKYQKEGVEYMIKNPHCFLGDEPGCLSYDTLISVRHKGKPETQHIKLGKLYEKCVLDREYVKTLRVKCLVNGSFQYLPVYNIVYSGIKPTLKVKTEDSEIELTHNHRVLTSKGWKKAADLTVGSGVICNGSEQKCVKCGSTENLITYPYSKFLGYCKPCMYSMRNSKVYKDKVGKRVDLDGYVHVFGLEYRDHPNYGNDGILEHHLIMSQYLGRPIDTKQEVVHHINHNKQDNRLENLQLLSKQEHSKIHADNSSLCLPQFSRDYIVRKGKKIIYKPQLKKVVSITDSVCQPVYDIQFVGDIHNFVANGIVVHNSGKTKQVIDLARYLKKFEGVKHVLIICGVNGNKFNWINEIEQHSEFHGHILGSRISKRTGRLNLGTMKDVVYDLRNLPPEFFYIINIEKLRGLHQKRKRGQRKSISEFPVAELIQSLIDKGEIGLVAVDEIHKVKSPTAIQSQALMWINCSRQVGMSGTLVINSPLDLYVPFKWMGFETRDYYHYQSRYAIKDFWGSVIGYQHAQEMMDILACYQLRRLRKDILDLPPKIHVNEYIEMSEAENKFYSAVQNGLAELYGTGSLSDFHSDMSLKADLFEKLSNIDNPLVLSLRLRQVTADTSLISDDPVPSSKMQRMEELVEEEVENGGKCIIFSNWSQVTEIAKKRLLKYRPAYITGNVKDDARFREMKRFQEDSSCKVIIGTIDALGTGFSLDAATQVIFLDEPWTQATKTQAEDRAYRAVTKHSVRIVTLIDKWTVDEHVHDIVEGKGAVADLIVDGVVNKNKKDELTRLLLGFDKFKLGSKKSINKKGCHK